MTCKQLVEFLEQYLAGELAVGVRENLESHLETCANCRRYLSSYQHTVRLAAFSAKHPDDAPPPEVPEELVQAVLSARRSAKR
jgi:anti-sigma factor RsiW